MLDKQSRQAVTNEVVPDSRHESTGPGFEVGFVRELRSLLKDHLDGADDSAVALGARSLSEIFAGTVPPHSVTPDAARSIGSVEIGGFTAWPIFITYAGGHRDAYATVYNSKQMEQRLVEFYTPGASSIRGGIGEAIRNVGQHGHNHYVVRYDECSFAPAALFVREISFRSAVGAHHRILMAMVTDEGSGIGDPERSLLNGVSGLGGDASLGMGIEMSSCLVYLVKSRAGEWCLFDRTRQENPDHYETRQSFKRRAIGADEKIERLATLDLPAPPKGCQKIMFFAHPSATAQDMKEVYDHILSALNMTKL
jgi:anti-sigma regulatory factor (Ser/Thr protein kinase)